MRDTTTSEDRDDVRDEAVVDADGPTAEQTDPGLHSSDEAAIERPKRRLGRRARRAAAQRRATTDKPADADPTADQSADDSTAAGATGGEGNAVVLTKSSTDATSQAERGSARPGAAGADAGKSPAARSGAAKASAAKAGKGRATSAMSVKAAKGAKPAGGSRMGARRLAQVITSLFAVAVLLAVLLLVQLIRGPGSGSAIEKREDRRELARQEAVDKTARLFSFDYRTLDADLQAQRDATTGSFSQEVQGLTGPSLRPIATKIQAVVQGRAVYSAVVDDGNGKGDVQVLVFLNQAVTSSVLPAPRIDRNRLVVTMQQVGSRWKVAGVKAL